MKPEEKRSYNQLNPSDSLSEFVDSYWEHKNPADTSNKITIFPDSFFKIIIYLTEGNAVKI